MKYANCAFAALFLVIFAVVGCTRSSVTTNDGETLVYVEDTSRPSGPDTRIVAAPVTAAEIPADQKEWAAKYDAMKKAAVPKAAVPKAAPQAAAGPKPLASPDDIKGVKERVAALKGSVKTAKNGAITSIKLAASGGDDPNSNVTLDDMNRIGRLGDLESVSFEGAIFTDAFIAPLVNCKKLNSVTINNADIQDATLEALATLPELTYLDIRRDLKLTNASLEVLKKMPKLAELHAHYNSFTNSGMAKLSKIPTLKIVDVRGCADVSDNGAKYLARLPELEEVYFRFMITNTGVEHLSAAPKLRFIEFQDCNDITDAALASFQKMASLKGLRIFRCKGFLDAAAAGVCVLPLERLELRDLNVSNAGIAPLAGNKTVKTLEMSELASVDAAGLNTALAGLTGLEKASFFSIALNDEGVALLTGNSPELKSLQLRAVAVTDQGIDSLLSLSKLETLDLRENSGLSADALVKLGSLKTLKTLYLKGTGITAKGAETQLDALKKALPKCRIEE